LKHYENSAAGVEGHPAIRFWTVEIAFGARAGPDNETTMGMDFDSAAQASVNETNEAHWFPLPIERGRRER
jgi:hypothetical protein